MIKTMKILHSEDIFFSGVWPQDKKKSTFEKDRYILGMSFPRLLIDLEKKRYSVAVKII